EWIAQTRGTDLITLAVVVPALVSSLILGARGSLRAEMIRLGVLGYALYMYVICAFDVVFNPLFLVYVALFSLLLTSLVTGLSEMEPEGLRVRFAPDLPVRAISIYLMTVAVLFCLAWMKDIVPAIIGNTTPADLQSVGLPTNPV